MTETIERGMSLTEIGRRIDLNRKSGWGLEKGTPPQLNLLALFCQRHGLLPGDDVTLYEGKPWITVDGRVKLLRRNHRDEYRGFTQRPLSSDEKIEWGYSPKDIVIETTIRTVTYGEIKGYGRVSLAEASGAKVEGVRHNAVARFQPVEMAMKRSLARAERFAFGTESLIDDEEVEEAARQVIVERTDPEVVARRSAQYEQIFAEDDTPRGRPVRAAPPEPEPQSEDELAERADALEDNRRLLDGGESVGVVGLHAFRAKEHWPLERILGANDELRERIRSREGDAVKVEEGQVELLN